MKRTKCQCTAKKKDKEDKTTGQTFIIDFSYWILNGFGITVRAEMITELILERVCPAILKIFYRI